MRWLIAFSLLVVALPFAGPAMARDSLGMFGAWGAFRDPQVPRCYALAKAVPSTLQRDYPPYADVAWWPRQGVRGQVHFRLSRKLAANAPITLILGRQRFSLTGGGGDAWAMDKAMDAAIIAAMLSSAEMIVNARGADGRGFSNSWKLDGAASAMDAAAVGCAQLK